MFSYKIFLLLVTFVCGAVVMGVELVGSRVLSPFFGNSIFVWGSLISVFMGGLSLGYYYGGIYSDKNPKLKKLAYIIILSAILLLITPFFGKSINEYISSMNMDLRYSSLLSAFILFFFPIACLGVVSPYIIKMSTNRLDNIGVRSGTVYAISTLGSILGTILTSFYLISFIGVKAIFYTYSSTLIILSLVMILIDKFTHKTVREESDNIIYLNKNN
jgi:predicted membrane-bound spermidine synthase